MQYNNETAFQHINALWFDVERGCNTTSTATGNGDVSLWFDVERGCITTGGADADRLVCCGLM